MLFKTLTLGINRPGKMKREIIDTAMLNYSLALEWLLEHYREEIMTIAQSGESVTSRSLLKIIDKPALKEINKFEIEPFKDSLKVEFTSIASAFIAQSRHVRAGFPCVLLDSLAYRSKMRQLIDLLTQGAISKKQFSKSESNLIAHANRVHMLYFGRYSIKRDYCLMYDETTGRFYAKLYLLNQKNRLSPQNTAPSKILRYVAPGMPTAEPSNSGRRYIILPLCFGTYQLENLKRAIINPSILHTARLVKRKDRYFLLLNIECEQGAQIKPVTTMGVARSETGLHYTVDGVENGRINSDDSSRAGLYAISAKIVKKAVEYRCQVVLEANGGQNDAVMRGKKLAPFSVTSYAALAKILAYKLPEAGLPAPIQVSTNGLYNTCPRCGFKTFKNRISDHIFACIDCGYACISEEVGSAGLASRLEKYKKDKIPIYYEIKDGAKIYYNDAVGFIFKTDEKEKSITQLCYQLSLLAHSVTHCGYDSRKYSMIKKLRGADNISDAIRIVEKTNTLRCN